MFSHVKHTPWSCAWTIVLFSSSFIVLKTKQDTETNINTRCYSIIFSSVQIVPSQRDKLDCVVSLDISTARLVQSLGAEHYETWNQLYHEIATKWILNAVTTGAHVLKGKIYQNIMVDLKVRYVYISICGLLDFWHNRTGLLFEYPGSVDYDHDINSLTETHLLQK